MTLALLALALSSALPSVDDGWPETVSSPASQDAAVVVGIEKYAFVSHVPFAARDAYAFWSFLVFDRGVPVERVSLLKEDPAKEEIEEAVRKRAAQVGPGGTLWFYFAGHGAPDPSGQDGLLVGVDAKETPESVAARSVTRGWLVRQLNASRARHVVVVLDACFSGRGRAGGEIARGLRPLLPLVALAGLTRGVILTGAASDQMSGPFDRARHGLFTYFLLGGLRGWGQKDSGGVTLEAAYQYARTAMEVVLSSGGREQTPGIEGPAAAKELALVRGLGEKGPPLPSLVAEAGEAPPPAEAVAAPPPNLIDGRFRPQLITGHVIRGWLGVGIQRLTPDLATLLGVGGTKGALVAEVMRGGPAARAGFKSGDVVVSLNGTPVNSPSELTRGVAIVGPGSKIAVGIVRNGKLQTLSVRVGERPDDGMPPPPLAVAAPSPNLIDGRYTLPSERVVYDTQTGLTWQRAIAPEKLNWSDAKSYCNALRLAGGGWRLPSKDELFSLVQVKSLGRTIDTVAFPDTPPDWFWTSSPLAGYSSYAWNVYFGDGYVDYLDVSVTNRVRCVR